LRTTINYDQQHSAPAASKISLNLPAQKLLIYHWWNWHLFHKLIDNIRLFGHPREVQLYRPIPFHNHLRFLSEQTNNIINVTVAIHKVSKVQIFKIFVTFILLYEIFFIKIVINDCCRRWHQLSWYLLLKQRCLVLKS